MRTDKFKFYKVQKNEDAEPYFEEDKGRGLLVVADGLGGSGSFVHVLKPDDYGESLAGRLKRFYLPEYYNDTDSLNDFQFDPWLDKLLKPMADDVADTSALWGSRIAIARLVYYLKTRPEIDLKSESERKEIVKFVYKGMTDTIKEFDLKSGEMSSQLLLPTTIVAVRYEKTQTEIVAEVIWAGDSRAYAIIPEKGLKQLSEDDEDGSGAINNLFAVKKNYGTSLHYKKYVLPLKSILFVCSDGFFDPFSPVDNLGVEAVFADSLLKSDGFNDLKKNWFEYFKPTTHDDCSISFAAFGYDSFEELKNSYADRARKVLDTLQEYLQYKKIIPIVNGEEDDPRDYVKGRAKQRKKEISLLMADEILAKQEDSNNMITPELIAVYKSLEKRCLEKTESDKKERKKAVRAKIEEHLLSSFSAAKEVFAPVDDSEIKEADKTSALIKSIIGVADEALNLEAEIRKCSCLRDDLKRNLSDQDIKIEAIKNAAESRRAELKTMVDFYEKMCVCAKTSYKYLVKSFGEEHIYTENEKDLIKRYESFKTETKRVLDSFNDIVKFLEKKSFPKGVMIVKFPKDEDICAASKVSLKSYNEIKDELLKTEESINKLENKLKELRLKYQNKVKDLCNVQLVLNAEVVKYFTEQACKTFSLPITEDEVKVLREELGSEIDKYLDENGKAFSEIIEKVINSETPTIIDSIFNQSKLRLCREIKYVDIALVKELIGKVDSMLLEYEDLSGIVVDQL